MICRNQNDGGRSRVGSSSEAAGDPGVTRVNKEDIVQGLRELGVRPGDHILVHSSLSRFGYVEGGAQTVIEALLATVAPEGTVLVPTLTGKSTDGPDNPPAFDVRATPCWTGRIPETFRLRPEARRSLHPTHSVAAIGALAHALTSGHEECYLPCGDGSPWVKLARAGGKLVFFGVNLNCNTTFHAAEELAGVPYHMQSRISRCRMTDWNGRTFERGYLLHQWGTPRRFEELEEAFLAMGLLRRGQIGAARVLVVDDGPMLEYTVDWLRRDPWALVPPNSRP